MGRQNLAATERRNSTFSVVWGVLLIVLGVLAVGSPMIVAVAVNVLISWLIIVAGLAHVAVAFHRKEAAHIIWRVLVGIAYLVFGIQLITHPTIGVASLTHVLALLFLLEGIFDIALFFQVPSAQGSGWVLFDGVVALILGLMIYLRWPSSSAWAISTLVGVNMIISGVTTVILSFAVRRATDNLPRPTP